MENYDDADQFETVDESEDPNTLSGTLSGLSTALNEMVNPTTTAQAQAAAQGFIDDYRKGSPDQAGIEKQMKANSDQIRQILRQARERISARKYDKRQQYLAMAAGFGAPTETGAFGESVSNVAKAMLPYREKEQKYTDERDDTVMQLDQAIGSVDDKELSQRLQMLMANRKISGELAREALRTLGKRVPTTANAANSLDRTYAKDYVEFIQGGAADGQRALDELRQAHGALTSGKDTLTGPVVGSVATVPIVGKWAQDVFNPDSANTQELVESTVQRSLRPILGSQFTAQEGERLISRVYNPRLEEGVNAQRLERLITQLQRAYDQKKAAAEYYEQNHTLAGFQGKTSWSVNEFMPDESWPGGASFRPTRQPREGGGEELAPEPMQYEDIKSGKAKRKGRRFRWPWQFAEGGEVDEVDPNEGGAPGRKVVIMPDGVPIEADENIPDEEVIDSYMSSGGIDPVTTSIESAVAAPLGFLAGKYGFRSGAKVYDNLPGNRIKPGEKRVLDILDFTDTSPQDLSQKLRNLQRKQVPANALDVSPPEMRGLAEASLLPRARQTREFTAETQGLQKDARTRVTDQLNQALAPSPYDAEMKRFRDLRKTNSKPLYDSAFAAFPKVSSTVISDVMESKEGRSAMKAAIKQWQKEYKGKPFGTPDATGMARSYPLEFLDLVKYYYDDEVDRLLPKNRPKYTEQVRKERDAFRNELDRLTGGDQSIYRKARNQYEKDSRLMEALEFGHDEYLRTSPEAAADYVSKLDFTERDALRSGVGESLLRMMKGPYTDANPAKKIAGSPDLMARLEPLFEKPKDFEIFQEALNAEMELHDARRGTLNKGKAATGKYEPPKGLIEHTAKEAPGLAVFSPLHWVLKHFRKGDTLSEKEADQVLQVLRTRDPKLIEKTLAPKFRRAMRRKKQAGKAGMVGAAAAAAAPWIRQPDEEASEEEMAVEMPDMSGTGRGLTPEQIKASQQPAFAKGGEVKRMARRLYDEATGKPVQIGDRIRWTPRDGVEEEVEVHHVEDPGPHSSGKVTVKHADGNTSRYYSGVFGLKLREPQPPKLDLVKKAKGGLARIRKYVK